MIVEALLHVKCSELISHYAPLSSAFGVIWAAPVIWPNGRHYGFACHFLQSASFDPTFVTLKRDYVAVRRVQTVASGRWLLVPGHL